LPDAHDRAIAEEQPYITRLYAQLDALRERTATRLAEIYQQEGWDEQSIWERDVFAARDLQRLQRLNGVDRGLCFGRLDFGAGGDGTARYIGRIGLSDDEYDQMLVDWRAPAAEPFYRATAADPGDVVRRRHIQVKRREVIGVDDEVFDAGVTGDSAATLSGEAALLASLAEARTGRMSDIVATIQAEQDRVIRSDARGILVVQGAPGTGKTVAALHRAAYLLYTHRDRLANSGVLVLGPNPTFLRYIDEVLPSLGETGVVLSTVADLYPGIEVTGEEPDDVARAKGMESMAGELAAAVKRLQRSPRQAIPIVVDDVMLTLEPSVIRDARSRARRSRRPHNAARPVFTREILTDLARQYTRQIGELDDDDLAEARFELSGDDDVQVVLDQLWPVMTPEKFLRRVFSSDHGAPWYRRNGEWTSADVPLLDEAAVLLGNAPDDAALAAERRQEAERRAEAEFARDLLSELELAIPVDADEVAERYRGVSQARPVNERAAGDREWAFGHVIVDEAQELSPMAWRMVMRRVPSKSLTVVGDIAQTGAADGARSWASVFDRIAGERWRQETLTINYRTPSEVMDVGAAVLRAIDPALEPPRSVRSTGVQPWAMRAARERVMEELADAVSAELKLVHDGSVAVIVPPGRDAAVRSELVELLPSASVGTGDPSGLDADVSVLTVRQAKGLEFDAVIVLEPSTIVSESSRGLTDLYVAVTRPTQRLGVVYTGELPDALAHLR
jgi:DNA helicase IV